jgi:hypothetical protein
MVSGKPIGSGPDLADESGAGLLQVVILGLFVAALAYYFSSRSVNFKRDMMRVHFRNEIVNDRALIKFDLVNRPLPHP